MGGWVAGWLGGWLENLILMKTQSSVWTWTWTLDFDLGFVNTECNYGYARDALKREDTASFVNRN